MFDLNTLPRISIKEISYKDIEITKDSSSPKKHFLYNKGIRWMVLDQHNNKEAKELYSQYDMAYGDVLITGFGFGFLANWIASKPEVKSVTVIEISEDIYNIYLKNNKLPEKVNVVIADASSYKTNMHYDCLFLDHYETNLYQWVFKDAKKIFKNIPNHNIFWFWSLELKMIECLLGIYSDTLNGPWLYSNSLDFYEIYKKFKNEVLDIPTLPKLSKSKINEYGYTYFDRIGYSIL